MKEIKLFTICSNRSRKNISAIYKLFDKCNNELGIKTYIKIGLDKILSNEEYLKIFDNFNVYVCMSKQEGGPLPAMEAMQRGCIVLSTEVGQMPELIDGNGFILKEDEFFDKIKWLKDNIDWLNQARKKSVDMMKLKRDSNNIRKLVKEFLNEVGIIC